MALGFPLGVGQSGKEIYYSRRSTLRQSAREDEPVPGRDSNRSKLGRGSDCGLVKVTEHCSSPSVGGPSTHIVSAELRLPFRLRFSLDNSGYKKYRMIRVEGRERGGAVDRISNPA